MLIQVLIYVHSNLFILIQDGSTTNDNKLGAVTCMDFTVNEIAICMASCTVEPPLKDSLELQTQKHFIIFNPSILKDVHWLRSDEGE